MQLVTGSNHSEIRWWSTGDQPALLAQASHARAAVSAGQQWTTLCARSESPSAGCGVHSLAVVNDSAAPLLVSAATDHTIQLWAMRCHADDQRCPADHAPCPLPHALQLLLVPAAAALQSFTPQSPCCPLPFTIPFPCRVSHSIDWLQTIHECHCRVIKLSLHDRVLFAGCEDGSFVLHHVDPPNHCQQQPAAAEPAAAEPATAEPAAAKAAAAEAVSGGSQPLAPLVRRLSTFEDSVGSERVVHDLAVAHDPRRRAVHVFCAAKDSNIYSFRLSLWNLQPRGKHQ